MVAPLFAFLLTWGLHIALVLGDCRPLSSCALKNSGSFQYYAGLSTANNRVLVDSGGLTPRTGPVMIVQMQGGEINNSDTDSYGDGVPGGGFGFLEDRLGEVGMYEFNHVSQFTAIVSGGQLYPLLTMELPLEHNYNSGFLLDSK